MWRSTCVRCPFPILLSSSLCTLYTCQLSGSLFFESASCCLHVPLLSRMTCSRHHIKALRHQRQSDNVADGHFGHSCMQTRSSQAALEKKVGMLETHQREIHEALLSMENEAARLYQVS